MNIQTAKMKNQKKTIKEHSLWGVYCGIILKLIVLLLIFFVVANSYIYLNQQIQTIERDNVRVTQKIENINRELKDLQNRYEHASSRAMIDRQIAKFNLKLREPEYAQTRKIFIYDQHAPQDEFAVEDGRAAAGAGRKVADSRKH